MIQRTTTCESYKQLYRCLEREESYYLKLMVKKGDASIHRGTIRGQGPLATEDHITMIDISDVPGDSLVIQLNPPMGFWTMDYIGVSYEHAEEMFSEELSPQHIETNASTSVADLISIVDERNYSMPNVGDWAKLTFTVPLKLESEPARTIFLKTTGYYEQRLQKNQAEQTSLCQQILETPGFMTKRAMDEFIKWQKEKLAQK